MLKAEPLIGVARYKSILRRYDNGRLRRQERGMRPCPGRLSSFDARWVKILVVIFREIVESAFKKSDDPVGAMRRCFFPLGNRTAVTSGFRNSFGRCLGLYHSQLNPLSVLKANFAQRPKYSVFVESFDGLCHG
jgi:hypothetical protein